MKRYLTYLLVLSYVLVNIGIAYGGATVTRTTTFTDGQTLTHTHLNDEFNNTALNPINNHNHDQDDSTNGYGAAITYLGTISQDVIIDDGTGQTTLTLDTGNTTAANGPLFILIHNEGAATVSGDSLGVIQAKGYDTAVQLGGEIEFLAGDTWGNSSTDAPTDIVFNLAPNASETLAEVMRIESTADVGIGETDPEELLHITDGTALTTLLIESESTTAASGARLQLRHDEGDTDSGDVVGIISAVGFDTALTEGATITFVADAEWGNSGTDAPTNIVFKVAPDGSQTLAEVMRIESTADVGIGETDPEELLHVTDGTAQTTLLIESESTTAAQGPRIILRHDDGDTDASDVLGIIEAYGYDTALTMGASIEFIADAEWSGSTDAPTAIIVKVAPDGSQTLAEAWGIQEDGQLRDESWPAFMMNLGANITAADNTTTVLPFDTTVYEYGAFFDESSNYTWTPTTKGIYEVSCTLSVSDAHIPTDQIITVEIQVDGSVVARSENNGMANALNKSVNVSWQELSDGTDVIRCMYAVDPSSGATIINGGAFQTYFYGHRVK